MEKNGPIGLFINRQHNEVNVKSVEVYSLAIIYLFSYNCDVLCSLKKQQFTLWISSDAFSQGLNPGKAIAEIKKMMATYKEKNTATA